MKQSKISVSTKNDAGVKETWDVQCAEFEATDIAVEFSEEAGKYLTAESVLSLVNRQYQTDKANSSRRERTAGPAKRVETESMIRMLMSAPFSLTREQAEAKVAEARVS